MTHNTPINQNNTAPPQMTNRNSTMTRENHELEELIGRFSARVEACFPGAYFLRNGLDFSDSYTLTREPWNYLGRDGHGNYHPQPQGITVDLLLDYSFIEQSHSVDENCRGISRLNRPAFLESALAQNNLRTQLNVNVGSTNLNIFRCEIIGNRIDDLEVSTDADQIIQMIPSEYLRRIEGLEGRSGDYALNLALDLFCWDNDMLRPYTPE